MSEHQTQQYTPVNTKQSVRNKCNIRKKTFYNTSGMQCFGLVTIVLLIGSILGIVVHHTNSSALKTPESLRFVVLVTRHGARAPIFVYPNDPYSNITKYWPEGLMSLTKIGKQQMYKLGQVLRKIYDGFLSEHYLQKEFTSQSTREERTYMSAATLLAGLYPPKTYQIWNPDVPWQPIPIYSTSIDNYNLPGKPYLCPAYWKELNYSLDSIAIQKQDQELFAILANYTGTDASLGDVFKLWDSLTCEFWNDMKLPKWTQTIYPDKMKEPVIAVFDALAVGTKKMLRLFIGPLLHLLVSHMSDKVNGTLEPDKKMFYHSAHDLTLLGLKKALGIDDTGIVNPGSSMLLELHCNEENKYYVKMLLTEGTKSTPKPVETEIPNCESPCYFENFTAAVSQYLVTHWNEECHLTN